MDFSGKEEEAPTQGKNVLNFPYSGSEDQEEQEDSLVKQSQERIEEFPSPTPKEDQGEPME